MHTSELGRAQLDKIAAQIIYYPGFKNGIGSTFRIESHIKVCQFQNTVCNLVEKWNTYNVLYKVENDNIVFDL